MGELCFDDVYQAHSAMVYWVANGVSHNHDTALEITQQVFLRAYEKWELVGALNAAQAKSWLYKTARNAAIDRLRKDRRETIHETPPERADTRAGVEEAVVRTETTRTLWRLVNDLPEKYRAPVVLHYFAHLSQQEAAEALSLSDSTYRSRLTRARAMLEKQLEKEEMPV
ncbi:sigma-70 family RNA polymerase sigma factor [Christensenellaceae bacterium OttesenSCG-928-L17]|nr:sigma-70 family RNA polymerase sigma factor [Christensenellaceae bacterium OttesenSCG-928-L17]